MTFASVGRAGLVLAAMFAYCQFAAAQSAAPDKPQVPTVAPSSAQAVTPLPALEVVGKKKLKKDAPKPKAAKVKAPAATITPAGNDAAFPEGVASPAVAAGPFSAEQRNVYTSIGSSAYVSGETLNRFSGTSPADVVRGIPGVHVGDGRNGGALDVNIRGLQGQRRIAVTIDGSEQALDTYRGYAGQQQRNYIDPDLISDISVTKGPGPAQSAIGGTVAMTTLKPEDILLDGHSYGARVRGSIASSSTEIPDQYRVAPDTSRNSIFEPQSGTGSAAFAARTEAFDFVGAYARRDQGNYYSGKNGDVDKYRNVLKFGPVTQELPSIAQLYKPGSEVLNTSVDSDSILLKGTLRPAEGHSLELGYRKLMSEYGEIMPSQIIRNMSGTIPQWEPTKIDIDTFTARYKFKPKDSPLIDFKLNGYYTNTFSDGFNGPGTYGPLFGLPPPDPFSEDGYKRAYGAKIQSERMGVDLANTSRLATPLGRFTFDYGGAYTQEDVTPGDDRVIPLEDLQQNRFYRNATRYELAGFGNVSWQPTDALTLEAGGRYSSSRTRDRNRKSVAQRNAAGRFIIFLRRGDDGTETPVGNAYWPANAKGQFEAANDPRNNPNSIVNLDTGSRITYGSLLASAPGAIRAQLSPPNTRLLGYKFDEPLEREDSGFAPSIRGSYELFKGTKLLASYSEGLRLPGIFESTLWYSEVNPTSGDLEPERARNAEFGISTTRQNLFAKDDEGLMKVTYFHNIVDNYISRYQGPMASYVVENNDSFTVSGTELQLAYDAGVFFTDLSFTYYYEAITCNAKRAAERRAVYEEKTPDCINGGFAGSYTNSQNPPQFTLNATVGVRLFDERLTLGGRMIKTSDPIAELNAPGNGDVTSLQVPYHAVAIYDLFASYKFDEANVATFNIDNVMDTYFLDPLATTFNPAPGRTFKLGMTAKF